MTMAEGYLYLYIYISGRWPDTVKEPGVPARSAESRSGTNFQVLKNEFASAQLYKYTVICENRDFRVAFKTC